MDELIGRFDRALRAVAGVAVRAGRVSPAHGEPRPDLEVGEARMVARLVRVDHAGEVAAQALYEGQAVTARNTEQAARLRAAASEEADHLAWCAERLAELGARPSLLGPLWYAGSFAIGAAAGAAGDRVSLGFVAETEWQVERHLADHLQRVPAHDTRTRAMLEQMRADEARHGADARHAGGVPLPAPVRGAMHLVSRVMTGGAYWL